MAIWTILADSVFAVQVLLALPVLYLCVLAIAAVTADGRRRDEPGAIGHPPFQRFVVLVPAHNEETMIGALLTSLRATTYPRDHYEIYVVADNCSDLTAEIARGYAGVAVLERFHAADRGKGYALQWALRELRTRQVNYDACVVLDADSVVEPTFLGAFAVALADGAGAAQARNTVLNPLEAPSAALRWLALTLMNHVRPLGRNALRASATLTGNGMCLTRGLLDRHPWRAFGITEDYEYYLELVSRGERVRYVPEAVVRSHMPTSFSQLQTQDIRWESGTRAMSPWRIGVRLLWSGLRERDLVRLEALAELATPPLSSLVGASLLTVVAAVLLRSPLALLLGTLLLGAIAAYCASAFYVLRPARALYRMLAYAPLYMARKLWIRLVLRRTRAHAGQWVRTVRPAEAE